MDNQVISDPVAQPSKKSSGIVRFLWRLLIVFAVLLVVLISAGFIIGRYYQDEVKEYVITQLNKQLNN